MTLDRDLLRRIAVLTVAAMSIPFFVLSVVWFPSFTIAGIVGGIMCWMAATALGVHFLFDEFTKAAFTPPEDQGDDEP